MRPSPWNTAPLIYFIEENPTYLAKTRAFFEALNSGEFRVVTSMVTLIEVLVHPFRQNDAPLAERYRDILIGTKGLSVVPLSTEIAERAARLRAHLSEATVKTHLIHVFNKLGVADRTAAVTTALERGILGLGGP